MRVLSGRSSRLESLFFVERNGGRCASWIDDDFLDPSLGIAELGFAMGFEGSALFVNCNRFLQRHLTLLELLHNRLQLLKRLFEAQGCDATRLFVVFAHASRQTYVWTGLYMVWRREVELFDARIRLRKLQNEEIRALRWPT